MSAPGVYAAIHAVAAELATAGIAKARTNDADGYLYRSIDDVLDRLAPLLAKHRLCILPNAADRTVLERRGEGEGLLLHVALRVAFTLTSVDDGTSHVVEAYGEALDGGDKATAKAMSVAYKSAMVQTFCIPVCAGDEPDKTSHRLSVRTHSVEPVQGWEQWSADIIEIIGLCESEDALRLVQDRQRELLLAISRERSDLYTDLGAAFGSRREWLQARSSVRPKKDGTRRRRSNPVTAKSKLQVEHA